MKITTKDKIIILVFIIVSLAVFAAGGVYYYDWYTTRAEERAVIVAQEKEQKEKEKAAQEEAERLRKEEEKRQKKLEKIEAAKEAVIPAFSTFLTEYQASAEYNMDGDKYFIYDMNEDGIPELFLTSVGQQSTFLRNYKFYKYNLTSGEVEELKASTEPILNFYTGKNGIYTCTIKNDGTISYYEYKLKGGTLKRTELGHFELDRSTGICKINGATVTMDEYIPAEADFYWEFVSEHQEIQEYFMMDTTALDAYNGDANINESDTIFANSDAIAAYGHDGKLLFQAEDVLDLGDYYQVVGELWQNAYVSQKEVKGSQVGDMMEIQGSYFTITEISDDVIYFANENACLRRTFEGSEGYEYYGGIPKKQYQLFKMDTGRPYHFEITSSITLFFNKDAVVVEAETDSATETYTHNLVSAEEFLQTDSWGNLYQSDSYGYVRVENGMIYQYNELP